MIFSNISESEKDGELRNQVPKEVSESEEGWQLISNIGFRKYLNKRIKFHDLASKMSKNWIQL